MNNAAPDPVTQVLGQLLRQPEARRDVELERALLRLQAARPDAAYLLLHRLMVLETALQQMKSGAEAAALMSTASPPGRSAATAARPRSFLRDAAVITVGVVAGQALWQGFSDEPGADGGDGFDIDGWL